MKAAIDAGAMVSITARLNSLVKAAISSISDAEVAEIPLTAFESKKKSEQLLGRVVVRRILDLNKTVAARQGTLFDLFRFHAFFTNSRMNIVDADKIHRQPAVSRLIPT